jgi:hypothetical protein
MDADRKAIEEHWPLGNVLRRLDGSLLLACPTARGSRCLTFIALALFTLLSSCGGHLPVGL